MPRMVTVVFGDPARVELGHNDPLIEGAVEFTVRLTVMVCDLLEEATPVAAKVTFATYGAVCGDNPLASTCKVRRSGHQAEYTRSLGLQVNQLAFQSEAVYETGPPVVLRTTESDRDQRRRGQGDSGPAEDQGRQRLRDYKRSQESSHPRCRWHSPRSEAA